MGRSNAGGESGGRDTVIASIETAKLLGVCPGSPVEGELTYCTAPLGARRELTGTLDGHELAITGVGPHGEGDIQITCASGLVVALDYRDDEGVVLAGLIWSSAEGPLGAAVYCVEAGTYTRERVPDMNDSKHYFRMTRFSKLGTCDVESAVPADVTGCIRE